MSKSISGTQTHSMFVASTPGLSMPTKWWQECVIYEVLVPSFQDSNGDGIGDLPGVCQRLDYLSWLNVDVLWLSPICQTTWLDIGYDVVDFKSIDPIFGTLDDFILLLEMAHARNMRVIVDYVPNHTSHQHAWFKQSRQDRHNPFREFYLWADPSEDQGPPNNWVNRFGECAWSFDEATDQYYFGTFTPEQPDLNWRCPEVQSEMMDVLHFWMDLGTDGVRVDALSHLVKDSRLRNNPTNVNYSDDQEPSNRLLPFYSQNQPELLEIIALIKRTLSRYPDRLFLGEVFQTPEQLSAYQRAGADLLLSTSLLYSEFDPLKLQVNIDHLESVTPHHAWPARASGDHDLQRWASKISAADLPMAALLSFTVRGTPTMVYGEELGLQDGNVPAHAMVDPSGRKDPRYGRDKHRIPMPWNSQQQAGFTTGQPWLPIDRNSRHKNVADQRDDDDSLLNFYHRLLTLRRSEKLLRIGDYRPLIPPQGVLAFERYDASSPNADKLLIILNFNDRPLDWPTILPGARVLLSTDGATDITAVPSLTIPARTGVILRVPN